MTLGGPQMSRLGSSLRECSAASTLVRAKPLMRQLGISRVTDITRMDRLGLHVFASVRPRSLTLRVNAGKGVLAAEAHVGALMEAVEHAVAEPQRSVWNPVPMALTEVSRGFAGRFDLLHLGPRQGIRAEGSPNVATVACEDLTSGGCFFLPATLVFMPFEGDLAAQIFGWSATGLASGNSVDEATLHGLFEVLERDAVAMNWAKDDSLWMPHAELPEPFAGLAENWQRIGIDLAVRSLPNALGLPCFEAYLHEACGSRIDIANGSGLHVDRGIALARAVCEAAQSRLSYIHGGRDDITRFYDALSTMGPALRGETKAGVLARSFDRARSARWADLPNSESGALTLGEILQSLLSRLACAGFDTVLRHRFDVDLGGLQVVKVVVPRCEDIEQDARRMGPRLLARVIGRG